MEMRIKIQIMEIVKKEIEIRKIIILRTWKDIEIQMKQRMKGLLHNFGGGLALDI